MAVRFFYEDIDFKIKNPGKTTQWIKESVKKERQNISDINFIFCSDKYLLNLNKRFLKRKTLTDIITFDYSEGELISGDIYISEERVRENSLIFNDAFEEELNRVIIHGILHLLGYKDKTSLDILKMRKKEDAYLSLHKRMFHVKQRLFKILAKSNVPRGTE
jgi:probable rRNA maturation factor